MPECKSCGAAIRWAISSRTEKPIPLDPKPRPDGNLVIEHKHGQDVARAATPDDKRLAREHFVSHFATCPDAAAWRGSGGS